MKLSALAVLVLVVLVTAQALAQDRQGTFVKVIRDRPTASSIVWLNTLHMHSIQPCYPPVSVQDDFYACVHMDDDVDNRNRIFRTAKRYAPAVRDILNLPNPTTPSAVISGPVTATVGTPVTLTATVTDPDFGDSWTFVWREYSATLRGGVFGTPTAAETTYTPTQAGGVDVLVLVTDDAGQEGTTPHPITVTVP